MADDAYFTTTIAAPPTPRLLFPVEPQPHETLLGFIVRCVERNRLGTPVTFMRAVGLDVKAKGDFLTRSQAELPALAQAFSMSTDALETLWGAEPLDEDRKRRLGGVWLRPALVEQARRRAPPSLKAGQSDDARWMIKPIGFCSTRWEFLTDRCPNSWCAKTLTWPRADSLHLCRHCGTPIARAARRTVPRQYRPSLEWMMALFSEDEALRQESVRRVPPSFEIDTPTEVFEVLLALRCAFRISGAKPEDEEPSDEFDDPGEEDELRHWVAAVRFLLEYPRPHWDILQRRFSDDCTRFHAAMRRIGHNSNVPIVRSEFDRLNRGVYNRPTVDRSRSQRKGGGTSAGRAAKALGVTPGALKQVVEAQLLAPIRTARARNKVSLFAEADIHSLQSACEASVSYRHFKTMTDLPRIAVEQMVALGLLERRVDPAVEILRNDKLLSEKSVRAFLTRFDSVPQKYNVPGWIRLHDAFMGVGGRQKPWGPVLASWLNGSLPGGLVNVGQFGSPTLAIYTGVARTLVMGGPSSTPWFNFEPNDYEEFTRDWLSVGETAAHLNCSAVEISFLFERRHLLPIKGVERTRYRRSEVEDFGKAWITNREAAMRMGVAPKRTWRHLEAYGLKSQLGRGFYRRDELEPIVDEEVRVRRLKAISASLS
ncbi:helix-turn-helix domain-containing protein [uncultured Brevundimonas sp.]|uniref:helix-turn-helix domain-containing protein n=1 Tax=uncultured Brevundimonas sp. TaxID=213418 RepID=UPI0025FA96C2|nr:helix-turn-helix domain-containing protein [uncultured Brevundimonas sp.]